MCRVGLGQAAAKDDNSGGRFLDGIIVGEEDETAIRVFASREVCVGGMMLFSGNARSSND